MQHSPTIISHWEKRQSRGRINVQSVSEEVGFTLYNWQCTLFLLHLHMDSDLSKTYWCRCDFVLCALFLLLFQTIRKSFLKFIAHIKCGRPGGEAHITPFLTALNWLSVCFRINFMVFKCLNGLKPSFLSDLLLHRHQILWSSGIIPRVRSKSHGEAVLSHGIIVPLYGRAWAFFHILLKTFC